MTDQINKSNAQPTKTKDHTSKKKGNREQEATNALRSGLFERQPEMMDSRNSNRQLVVDRSDDYPPSPTLLGSERKRHMSDTALVSSRASCWTAAYETNDKQLKMFFLCERSGRRPAICSRIDKFYHNRQLVNYMEYLLREDYIRNFLL